MPYVLRKINKAKWYKNINTSWLQEGELQADVFSSDLGTQANSLSVWYVDDDKSNLERIIAAYVAKQTHIAEFDYALIKLDFVEELSIKTQKSLGDSADSIVNETWHRDFIELTTLKLLNFAVTVQTNAEIKRISKKEVKTWLKNSFLANNLDSVGPEMLAEIKQL